MCNLESESKELEVSQSTLLEQVRKFPTAPAHPPSGIAIGSASLFFLVFSFSVTLPFLQSRRDEIGCDALCYGSMTSARNLLGLVGSVFVGSLSDRYGRKPCLALGIAASLLGVTLILGRGDLIGMWYGMVPGALLQQNSGVMKALFSDYLSNYPAADATALRTSAAGKLGMSAGFAYMAGPLLASTSLIADFEAAMRFSVATSVLSGVCVYLLPDVSTVGYASEIKNRPPFRMSLPVSLPPPPLLFLMVIRILIALAFHVFSIIWTVSLKARFDFGPKDHGIFMSFVGLVYALSQGFVAKAFLCRAGSERRTATLLLCCAVIGGGRVVALHTSSLSVVYMMFFLIVTALGIVDTVLTADAARLAVGSGFGKLFGVLEATKKGSGMVGPVLGGLIGKKFGTTMTLGTVIVCYMIVFGLVYFRYETYILATSKQKLVDVEIRKKKL